MDPSRVLIFIYLGGTTLQFVKCFSSGVFDHYQKVCQTMEVDHPGSPQDSEPPFKVVPDCITVNDVDVGKDFEVSLLADSKPFMGFMLQARQNDNAPPQGTFSVLNPGISRLQTCDGTAGRAATHTNNLDKTEVKVKWRASEPGVYYFRATFTETYVRFWLKKNFSQPTPAPTSTASTPTSSAFISSGPPTRNVKFPLCNWCLILFLFSYLFLVECVPSLIKPRSDHLIKVTSFISLACSVAAFILTLIHSKHVVYIIVTGMASALTLCTTTLIFISYFFISPGPSHAKRKSFCWVFRVVAVVNICFTSAALFIGFMECERSCTWMPITMGVYMSCQLLLFPIFIFLQTSNKHNKTVLGTRVSYWCMSLVLFGAVNIAFTTALLSGMFCMRTCEP